MTERLTKQRIAELRSLLERAKAGSTKAETELLRAVPDLLEVAAASLAAGQSLNGLAQDGSPQQENIPAPPVKEPS